MQQNIEGLSEFANVEEIKVRWGDMDAFQHVNNTVYLKWTEVARVNYFAKYILSENYNHKIGPILARQDCRYIFPVRFPDKVFLGFRTKEIQNDRLICECKIFSAKHERLVAIIYLTIMAYNFEKLQKIDIPKDWKFKLAEADIH